MHVVLETERLILRTHTMADLDAMHAITSHPDVWRFDPGRQRTIDETRVLLVWRMMEYERRGIGRLALVEKASGQLIGYCGLQLCLLEACYALNTPEIEFFYGLMRNRWGQGLMTEAGHALIGYGFEELKLKRIISSALSGNERSINVMRRVGMRIETCPCDAEWVVGTIDNPRQ
jgi:[ribosomal protein S5]-alanine N-acetyltransferase